jgi:DDE_Tnp_1-associated
MESDGIQFAAIAETTSFLHYFSGLPDHRQAGKVDYPLPEVLLLILLAVLAGAEAFTDIAELASGRLNCCGGFGPMRTARPRTIISAIFSPRSTPAPSSFASWPGSRR